MAGFVGISSSGCLLPLLIIFNLLFGRIIFNSTRLWLGVEVGLILIFMININILARKISRQFKPLGRPSSSDRQGFSPRGEVVDIQGQVVEEDKRLGQ